MAVEHKSLGEDLDQAMSQVFDYLDSLEPVAAPWLVVACDFQNFYWKDLRSRTEGRFTLDQLADHVEIFWWLAGHQESTEFVDEEEANLVATGYRATLHDAMLASGYDPHALREWLTRILFCLFADDTEVWDRDAFKHHIFLNTRPDGADLGPTLAYLFQLLDTAPDKRAKNLDEDLAVFTYINGDLFSNTLPIPNCDEAIRTALLEACKFDWSAISPAIFGSMFQDVMEPEERRHLGAHYTTEENILKTIEPLFLEDLEKELAGIRVANSTQSRAALTAFHDKLANLTFLDPACGCGNFLVIAYREIRRLETEVLRKLYSSAIDRGGQVLDVEHLLKVSVGQFYGIEIEEFPARIARTALYLMDHKANREFSSEFGAYFARFPIPSSPHIRIDNALRFDWNELLPAKEANFVFGNPPFVGMALMDSDQQQDNRLVFSVPEVASLRTGRLDYVSCWYEKAMTYANPATRIAFVSTNSITQGEQARTLGPLLALRGYVIDFAHTTFAWSSEARGTAHVHCVIVGFSKGPGISRKVLYRYATLTSDPVEEPVSEISIYLSAVGSIVLERRRKTLLEGFPTATKGSQPTDGGFLILDTEEIVEVRKDAVATKYIRRFVQSRDMIHGEERWCLWLVDTPPNELRASAVLRHRLESVASWRRTVSKTESVRMAAAPPALFTQIRQPSTRYLAMPEVSSSGRRYIPGQFFTPDVIAGNKLIVFPGAQEWLFSLLHSTMWNAWMREVSGRLKSDISFSPSIGYFSFPFPILDGGSKEVLSSLGSQILEIRESHEGSSLADLYDPLTMPGDLLRAHQRLDDLVDGLYSTKITGDSDAQRLATLFERYEQLQPPLLTVSVEK